MIFRITMKDPDGVYDSIRCASRAALYDLPREVDDTALEMEKNLSEKNEEICRRWFLYREYLTVEIDTEAGTCEVVPCE